MKSGASSLRKLSFGEFWEALVRCAIVAYSVEKNPSVTTHIPDKIRGLFLVMWREINKTVPLAVSSSAALGNYSGSLVEGARLFNNRVSTDWAKDGYRDYLNSTRAEVFDGRATLQRLCAERAGGKASPFAERQSDAGRADVLQRLIDGGGPGVMGKADPSVVMEELDYQLRRQGMTAAPRDDAYY